MSERKWTDEQLSAIETRDKTLLVSAAAGSGKTATLTERIIRSLCDAENPTSVTSLLVVTFTNAAAGELRAKLAKALEEAVRRNPESTALERQLCLLPAAKIRTIDSFCNDILRTNCDRVGVSPNYRIADTAECELLAISILEGLIESVYLGQIPEVATPEAFEALADCLTDSKRTEELSEVLRYVYSKCESSEDGVDSLLPLIDALDADFESVEKTTHGAYLMERVDEFLSHYISAISTYERIFSSGTDSELVYLPMVEADLEILNSMKRSIGYSALRDAISGVQFMTKPTVRKGRTDSMERYSALRDMFKADLKDIGGYFLYTEDMWRNLYRELRERLLVLYRFEKCFDGLFLEEKKRRGSLSYADIERLCYECLINDGKPTDIAKNLSNQFTDIYIDEYQDVNGLQNKIFEAISKPNNRFMVGDIKQSIYGFRSARPEIFADMKSAFPPLSEATGDAATIFMSRNFRCDKGIVDFVNGIFDRIFGLIGESIGYADGDRLGYANLHDGGEPEYFRPEICMIDKAPRGTASENDDGVLDATEPEVVAEKIAELLKDGVLDNGKPIAPSDIAILLRNASGKDILYAEALKNKGIPLEISGAKDFFLSSEVLLALCLLNSIDNPRRDIYLAGLMCSPLFNFTADDLYVIRRDAPGETLYESLVSYTDLHEEFSRGKEFLRTLGYYRSISEGIGVDTLISKLYRETGLMALASRSGGKENLTVLYDYARNYESGSFSGLYNFISFINSVIDKKTTFDDKRAGASGDAVKIVTCHASKGLEYPVVFLCSAGSAFSSRDTKSRLVFAENFGISFRLRTPSGLAVVNNPLHDIICHRISSKSYEEELRVLYVALTRAREKLFVVGTSPSTKREEYEYKLSVKRDHLSPYGAKELSSYLEIMLVAGDGSTAYTPDEFLSGGYEMKTEEIAKECEVDIFKDTEALGENDTCDDTLAEELYQRFTYQYPYKHNTSLPEKMSVSKTSPTVLDEADELAGVVEVTSEGDEERQRLPKFVTGGDENESAERGIATHYFMQFCDLENFAAKGARAELDRLLSEGFISKRDYERVRVPEIELFGKSRLFADMRAAKRVWRELRFNIRLPAVYFTEDEEKRSAYADKKMLVQGVIDCIVEYPDGTLGLYDYKTDRLTKEERADRALAEEKLRRAHEIQLYYYSLAVERMFGKRPDKVEVYSLHLGDTVNVSRKNIL